MSDTTPPPTAREAAAMAIIEAFHDLHPRIPGIAKGDCHCNLLAEVALDAAAPILLADLAVSVWGQGTAYLTRAEVTELRDHLDDVLAADPDNAEETP